MKHELTSSLLLLLAIFTPSAVQAQESLSEWGDELFRDGQTLATAPMHWQQAEWENAAGLVVITGTLMATADHDVSDYHNRHRRSGMNNIMQDVGDALSPVALLGYSAVIWGTGQMMPNDTLSRSGFKMGEAVLYATAITGGLKVIAGRARPNTGSGAGDFSPWSWQDDHQSFPSAHAAAAFAAARVISPQLTPAQRIGAYGAATLVSYSRIYQGDHWLSDVVFGAGLGYAVGAMLTDKDDADQKNARSGWWLMPNASGISLGWLQTW